MSPFHQFINCQSKIMQDSSTCSFLEYPQHFFSFQLAQFSDDIQHSQHKEHITYQREHKTQTQKSQRPQTANLRVLVNLKKVLYHIFFNNYEGLQSDLTLNTIESQILISLLKKKFKLVEFDRNTTAIKDILTLLSDQKPQKRIEERKKFVYKHTIKLMKEYFFQQRKDMTDIKDEAEKNKKFYQHYLSENSINC